MSKEPFEEEILKQLAQLIGNGFLVVPIDPELKTEYFNTCLKNNRNPFDQLKTDMKKRVRVLNKREQEAKDEEEKKKAEKQAQPKSFLEKTATMLRNNEVTRKKD